ncbi:hypothetical protein [Nocardia alni]|uniref:hypothetical protein n=1 Tax=Nocardia alni TaxID=2815723 RepID=UPI001C230FCF|nr:hypothetical protein [Nocardia alni]
MTPERPRLILVGNGRKEDWERVLPDLAERYELSLISGGYPTWEAAWVEKHRVADTGQYASLFTALCDLRGEVSVAAVFSLDSRSVAPLAEAARKLRIRDVAAFAAELCADPALLRAKLVESGVHTADGDTEVLVSSVVLDGAVRPVSVVRSGPGGSSVSPVEGWHAEEWSGSVSSLVEAAHRAIGVDWAVTATGLRLDGGTARITTLEPWLGERFGTVVAASAAGLVLARAAAAIAFEQLPDLSGIAD